MVRCKFVCTEHREFKYGAEILHGYKFSPVTSGSKENEQFFKWTPSGSLEFGTVQAQAFEIGKEYYLDLSEPEPVSQEVEAGPA
jgi:hypothetical protein